MKLHNNIINELNDIKGSILTISRNVDRTTNRDELITNQSTIIREQNRIINDLINNIYSKDTSLEAVMIKPYRSKPVIFKDGKRLDTEAMTSFCIDWNYDSRIDISVRNE